MNTRIYFNTNFIQFGATKTQTTGDQSIKLDNPNAGQLVESVLGLLRGKHAKNIILPNNQLESSLEWLKKEFYYIEAAGGLIEREGRYLCIHRFGRWDLPKGKLESNESPEQASIRECEEECGVRQLKIERPLSPTLHLYAYKSGYALKKTFWYLMTTDFKGTLVPQTEESIDRVSWFTAPELRNTVIPDTYLTIRDVIGEVLVD